MRKLTLVRHAKSDQSSNGGPAWSDAMRPLAPRGIAAAPVIARWLGANLTKPDAVLCSTAERTRATWALLASSWGLPPSCRFEDALYLADTTTLLARIRQTPPAVGHFMVIGHNPGLHELAIALTANATGVARTADQHALATKFPTGGVAVLSFPVTNWAMVATNTGQLAHFVSPRRLAL